MPATGDGTHAGEMAMRFPAIFSVGGDQPVAGAAVVEGERLLLEGRDVALVVPCAQVAEVRIGRDAPELLNGRPSIVVDRGDAEPLLIAPLGPGLLAELAGLLTALSEAGPRQAEELVVLVPLRDGGGEVARRLLEAGPPFDPARLGIERHRVLLGEREALFVFVGGRDLRRLLERSWRSPELWRAGIAWRGCLAGAPSVLDELPARASGYELAYEWSALDRDAA